MEEMKSSSLPSLVAQSNRSNTSSTDGGNEL